MLSRSSWYWPLLWWWFTRQSVAIQLVPLCVQFTSSWLFSRVLPKQEPLRVTFYYVLLSTGLPFATDRDTNMYSSVCGIARQNWGTERMTWYLWRRELNYQIHLVVPQSVDGRFVLVWPSVGGCELVALAIDEHVSHISLNPSTLTTTTTPNSTSVLHPQPDLPQSVCTLSAGQRREVTLFASQTLR